MFNTWSDWIMNFIKELKDFNTFPEKSKPIFLNLHFWGTNNDIYL